MGRDPPSASAGGASVLSAGLVPRVAEGTFAPGRSPAASPSYKIFGVGPEKCHTALSPRPHAGSSLRCMPIAVGGLCRSSAGRFWPYPFVLVTAPSSRMPVIVSLLLHAFP